MLAAVAIVVAVIGIFLMVKTGRAKRIWAKLRGVGKKAKGMDSCCIFLSLARMAYSSELDFSFTVIVRHLLPT